MKKTITAAFFLLALMVMALAPSRASAETGIQLRVPYQVATQSPALKGGAGGFSILLSFGMDADTTVGLLSETINFTDKTAAGADVIGAYNVTAIRISKEMTDPLFVAVDLGSASSGVSQASMADIAFGGHLLSSKGKLSSYINVELMYRILNPGASFVATGTATNYGGLFLNIGAGLSF